MKLLLLKRFLINREENLPPEYRNLNTPSCPKTGPPHNTFSTGPFDATLLRTLSQERLESSVMSRVVHPWELLIVAVAGWINRDQQAVIDYLVEENRVLKGQLR